MMDIYDGISLHRTMVQLRFFFVVGAKSTSSYPDLQGRGNMVLQLISATLQDSAIIQKIAGKFPVYVWG
jgi:hypothetical protein